MSKGDRIWPQGRNKTLRAQKCERRSEKKAKGKRWARVLSRLVEF